MKKVFTGDDDEEVDQMIEESKEFYFLPILLNQTTKSILKHSALKTICPLLTDKKFNYLL